MLQINKKEKTKLDHFIKNNAYYYNSYYHFIKAIDPISLGHTKHM